MPNLQQVWQHYSSNTNLASFWQRQLGNTKAIKELQASHTKIKTTCITGSFMFRALLALNRLKPRTKRPETSVSGLEHLVENRGIEPLTSGLQSPRSPSWANSPYDGAQIRIRALVIITPAATRLSLGWLLSQEWWAWQGLNLWPPGYQPDALTNWATGPTQEAMIQRSFPTVNTFLNLF